MAVAAKDKSYLAGQLLVAMPGMMDPRFTKTVIYMCAHNADGAMGLVVNKLIESLSFPDLLAQLGIESVGIGDQIKIHFGGPVESSRGFVLHSPDYRRDATLIVDEQMALTATVDILKAIAIGSGPRRSLLALGYAGWGPGQLDDEIKANGWLHVAADDDLVFGAGNVDDKWERAMAKLGIDPRMLSDSAGHA
ncbi:YqgE/AlgH family protein [Shumkonia mesophila]|uniref:YqgE/AlgH family protein n=1 Tax=Shumkonia mesophila TaxID=2838854 RepID=UPI0029350EB5|nr:YqgE/AlgH family protein [Shumkonia mesophila]